MEAVTDTQVAENTSNGRVKPKIVVIMGPTGSGKSRLAIDLASHFSIEIINADSMQVYRGLDVLTNKVPPDDQKGVPHHLLGTVSPKLEYTAKEFRDSAISVINDILHRNSLPVIVGGTNYYIQALVSPFLLDDSAEEKVGTCFSSPGDEEADKESDFERDDFNFSYNHLKEIDPVAANRIHPNDHRKVKQYLSLYFRSGVLPSKIFQGKAAENWGRADYFRYNCCFICVDASLPVLDQHVDQRVDDMVATGLLDEVYDIYNLKADYSRGLRQAIGVREFEDFLKLYVPGGKFDEESAMLDESISPKSMSDRDVILKENMREILNSSSDNQLKILLKEAIAKVKLNTRRLARRQRRRLSRLQTLFGWNIHYVDSTEFISCKSEQSWTAQVVEPSIKMISSFLADKANSVNVFGAQHSSGIKIMQRDLWSQYTCKACENKVLRGEHEWEQHKQGRGHRKRIYRLRKSENSSLRDQKQQYP